MFGEHWLFPLYPAPGREEGGEGEEGGEEGGEGLGGVELPKRGGGDNTRSRCHRTKGLPAGKRATKEQQ